MFNIEYQTGLKSSLTLLSLKKGEATLTAPMTTPRTPCRQRLSARWLISPATGTVPGSAAFEKVPLWLITAIVFRAGAVEELFYRDYAIERMRMIGLGRVWSVAIPLVIFSLGHWSGGAANILIAFAQV